MEFIQRKAITEESDRLQASLDISQILIKIAYFDLGETKSDRLLIIIHHLLIDGISWRILLEDLQTAYQQALNNKIQLPVKTISYKQWSQDLNNYLENSSDLDIAYWLEQDKYSDYLILADEALSENSSNIEQKTIIVYCQTNTGSYTPSDFTLTKLEQNTIESISNIVDFND